METDILHNELQRKELQRLLDSAENHHRKELIEESIKALDGGEKKLRRMSSFPTKSLRVETSINDDTIVSGSKTLNPYVNRLIGESKFTTDSKFISLSPKSRPMSAMRRSSFMPSNLDIIHENKWLHADNNANNHASDIDLSCDDLTGVFPSSGKCILLTKLLNNSSPQCYWLSTGLVPQFLTILLHDRWLIRKLCITCMGAEEIYVSFDFSKEKFQCIRDSTSDFIFDVKDHIVEGHNTSGRQKITFYFMKAIVSFLKVSNIKINAAPYV